MDFLNELKARALAAQAAKTVAQTQAQMDAERRLGTTETASQRAWVYLSDMVQHLNILVPEGPKFSVDGKTPWPRMKLVDFRADSRKKTLNKREVFAHIGVGWDIVPMQGQPVLERISVNFLPELQKVEARLKAGNIQHERLQIRHPEKKSVQAITFEHQTFARGSVTITPDHEQGTMGFRFCNVNGLAVQTGNWPSETITTTFLDELAKLLVSQPSRLFPTPE